MKFKRKPVIIEATQWFVNGDHPKDNIRMIIIDDKGFSKSEGKVVRYYRNPEDDGKRKCKYCGNVMHDHGWIDTLEGGHTVCPGDWIITGVEGEYYPCKPYIFEKIYEKIKE